ncbi:MAG: DUF6319 family protein, partial [Gordonia sp. (in: high G+C Gram-positive bacteria)]
LREGTPSLDLAPGSSARVVSVEGTTLLIRPRGVDDELPYEADELRITKEAPPKPEPAKNARPAKSTAAKPPTTSSHPVTPTPATPNPAPTPAAEKPAPRVDPPAAKPAKSPARRPAKKAPASVTVTVYGSAENEWSVSVTRGARKPQRSRPLSAESVDAAVRQLGDDAALDTVQALMHAARDEAQRRVEELSRELEAARQALAELGGESPAP